MTSDALGETDGPVVLVTAAGGGIGTACVRKLASSGYKLALMSPGGSAERLGQELNCTWVTGSMTEPDDLEALAKLAFAEYGRIDGAVLNAGILKSSKRSGSDASASGQAYDPQHDFDPNELDDEAWQEGFEMMLLGVIRIARHLVPIMKNQGGGAVVAISTFSDAEPRMHYPVSSVIRGGLRSMMKLYADRFARDGIRFNSVLPGFMDNWDQPEDVHRAIPMGRLGKVEELAETVEFLLSDRSSYVTGQSILVDGGANRSV